MHRVERTIELPGPVAEVWRSITSGLSAWFGAEVELDGRPGGRATFRWPDGRVRGAVVEEFQPPSRFAFRWLPFERVGGETRMVPGTRVEFDLHGSGEGVRLRVTERPLAAGGVLLSSRRDPAWVR
jgi:uncharacterized protein YndB with AHSA1/START domain